MCQNLTKLYKFLRQYAYFFSTWQSHLRSLWDMTKSSLNSTRPTIQCHRTLKRSIRWRSQDSGEGSFCHGIEIAVFLAPKTMCWTLKCMMATFSTMPADFFYFSRRGELEYWLRRQSHQNSISLVNFVVEIFNLNI